MIKFSKWLWAKAEAVCVREMLSLIDGYFVEPVPPSDSATPAQRAQFNRDLAIYKAGRTFRAMFLSHFERVFDSEHPRIQLNYINHIADDGPTLPAPSEHIQTIKKGL